MGHRIRLTIVRGGALVLLMLAAAPARAQDVDHHDMNMNDDQWMVAQDGIVFAEFNRQGGARGGSEFVAPNWWMGVASRGT
jgi:hypothetical protein